MSDGATPGPSPRTALEWFTAMRGPDAGHQRSAFEQWLSAPGNAEDYAEVVATWDQTMFVANTAMGRDRNLDRARSRRPLALIAAGLVALAAISGGYYALRHERFGAGPMQQSGAVDIVADRLARRTVRLADGSRVTLDRDAAVRDLGSAKERHLLVLRGRVRFDVAHDADRPFIVDAGRGRVIAHGTIFDVALEGENVRVALVRGSVEVRRRGDPGSPAERPRLLAPGEQLVVRHDRLDEPTRADSHALAWPDPMISFDGELLSQAIETFNRSSRRKIRLDAVAVAGERLSGAFRRDDPEGFAETIAVSFSLAVDHGASGAIVLRPGPAEAGEKIVTG
ncbi:MAG: FecR domain-containing protein [Candidatus Sphingomonas phytovorans]|nr:FecR domain-containing protein [Sphingomonas sp.]WEK02191.1 MAG: FecR domain-containing protein [Sphingomonas sp.]